MQNHMQDANGRGRPPKQRGDKLLTREMLVHVGTEVLTEKGYSAVGVDEILQRTGISRCSFYYYFKTKEGFGAELIDRYRLSITQKLERCLCDPSLSPLDGLRAFVGGVRDEMARTGCRSGCLIGKLAQEVNTLLALVAGEETPTCPHGRPILLPITKHDLERKFKRIQ